MPWESHVGSTFFSSISCPRGTFFHFFYLVSGKLNLELVTHFHEDKRPLLYINI